MGSDDSDGATDSLGGSVAKLLTGGLFSGDLPGNMDRGVYTTTRLAVEDGVGELLGPIAVWVVVGITCLVGIDFIAVGAIVMGVPNVGVLLLSAGATAVFGAALGAAALVVHARRDRSGEGERGT